MSYIINTLIPFLDMRSYQFAIPESISLQENQPIDKELLRNFKLLIYKNKKLFTQFSLYSVNFEQDLIANNNLNVSGILNGGVGIGNNQTLSIRLNIEINIENSLFNVNIDKQNSVFQVKDDIRNFDIIPNDIQNQCIINWQ